MPEVDIGKSEKKFYEDIPMKTTSFFLKGSNSLDWGDEKSTIPDIQSQDRSYGYVSHRPWIFPGANNRARAY